MNIYVCSNLEKKSCLSLTNIVFLLTKTKITENSHSLSRFSLKQTKKMKCILIPLQCHHTLITKYNWLKNNTLSTIKRTWDKQIYSALLHVSGLQDHRQWQYLRKWLNLLTVIFVSQLICYTPLKKMVLCIYCLTGILLCQ